MSSGRRRAKRGEGPQLRVEIMDVAERLLVERGDEDDVSVREIADAIGITSPSIYIHFADKEALFHAVCNRRFAEFADVLDVARTSVVEPIEALRRCGKAYFHFGFRHPESYSLLMMTKTRHHAGSPPSLDPEDAGTRAFLGLVEAVDRCVSSGAFRDVDSYQAAVVLWMAVHGATSLCITMPDFPFGGDPEEVIDRVLDIQVHGLLKEPIT